MAWLTDGSIAAPPVTPYPLEDVARAHADIESGQTTGKLILVPARQRERGRDL